MCVAGPKRGIKVETPQTPTFRYKRISSKVDYREALSDSDTTDDEESEKSTYKHNNENRKRKYNLTESETEAENIRNAGANDDSQGQLERDKRNRENSRASDRDGYEGYSSDDSVALLKCTKANNVANKKGTVERRLSSTYDISEEKEEPQKKKKKNSEEKPLFQNSEMTKVTESVPVKSPTKTPKHDQSGWKSPVVLLENKPEIRQLLATKKFTFELTRSDGETSDIDRKMSVSEDKPNIPSPGTKSKGITENNERLGDVSTLDITDHDSSPLKHGEEVEATSVENVGNPAVNTKNQGFEQSSARTYGNVNASGNVNTSHISHNTGILNSNPTNHTDLSQNADLQNLMNRGNQVHHTLSQKISVEEGYFETISTENNVSDRVRVRKILRQNNLFCNLPQGC